MVNGKFRIVTSKLQLHIVTCKDLLLYFFQLADPVFP